MSQFFVNEAASGTAIVETLNSQPPVGNNFNITSPDGSVNIVTTPGLVTLETAGTGIGTPYAIWNTDVAGTPAWRTTSTITGSYITTGGNLLLPYTNSSVSQGAIVYGPVGSGLQVMTCDAVNNFGCGPGVNTAVITSGADNLCYGIAGMGLLRTGYNNLGVGLRPFPGLVSGSQNTGIGCGNNGNGVGDNYTSSESNNILVCSAGVTGESNVARYGTQGTGDWQVNKSFMAGIAGVTGTSSATVVGLVTATGQLLQTTITAGTGVSVTAGAGTITIAATGTTNLTITSVNHAASPYTVLVTDDFIAVNTSGGVVTLLLPNAPATGKVYYIKDSTGSSATSNISVTTVGGTVTIDGATTYTIATNYESIGVIFDGTNYEVF